MFKKRYPKNPIEPMRCITFNKKAQDDLPEHIKAKMKADRDKAREYLNRPKESEQCHYCQNEMQVKDLKVVKVNKQRVYVCTDCLVKCNSPANRADSKE